MLKKQIIVIVFGSFIVSCSPKETHNHLNAKIQQKSNVDIGNVIDRQEYNNMKEYIKNHVDKEYIKYSFKLPSGQIYDCVDIYHQPALKHPKLKNHKIQFKPSSKLIEEEIDRDASKAKKSLLENQHHGKKCPKMTVPVKRITMDTLKKFKTLKEYHKKPPFKNKRSIHDYARAGHDGGSPYWKWGGYGILNIWRPYVEKPGELSLSQQWIAANASDPNIPDTVELGWVVYPNRYGDEEPHFFIFWSRDLNGQYGNDYCWDLDCGAFVQISNSVTIGGRYINVSEVGGTQWETYIQGFFKDGNTGHWWLKYNGEYIGYYHKDLFDTFGLQIHADYHQLGGEVTSSDPNDYTSSWMGSGYKAEYGWGTSAYIRRFGVYGCNSNGCWADGEIASDYGSIAETRPQCYTYHVFDPNGRYIYYGGYGY